MRLLARSAWLLLISASLAQAATPALNAVRPPGGQRGTEVEVTLSGSRLGDAREILFYRPGIEMLAIEKVDENGAKARLRIADDCALGLHDLRLRTATGISELRTFSVGALPEIQEAEPNDSFDEPQAIPLDVVVNGVAKREDVDYYAVEAKKGERITAEVEGIRLGITTFDPFVAILDEKRFELASSDDEALTYLDGCVSILAPEDGTYIIQVRESAYAGDDNSLYRLHVGRFPRPRATLPAGGPAGESVEVTWLGDIAGERTTEVSLPAEPDEAYGILAEDDKGIAPYPNAFRVSPFGNVLEVEPNDNAGTATPFTAPAALNGVIEKEGDVDHFVFPAKKGRVLDVRVHARTLRSPLDSVLVVSKKGGGNVANNDDTNGPDSYLRFTAPDDGEYVVSIRDHLRRGGPEFFYRIELTPVEPLLTMGLPTESLRRNGNPGVQAVAVPKGNRRAILVTATRSEFSGDLTLSADDLPAGMSLEADTMPGSQGTFPVLFVAAPDAPVAGQLTTIAGTPTDAEKKVPAVFRHPVELVLGANNTPVWTRTVDRMAVAVAEESPFSIEVVEPKVPLVRNGTMELKVVARRKEGFTAPIAVKLPWLPPGVGASASIVIAEGKDEALIPMNASANAAVRTWKVVVDGTATTSTGPLTVSSQLAPLAISEPFVALEYQNAVVEQGQSVDFLVKMTKLKDYPGEARVELVGLPNKATTEVKQVAQDATELLFPIATTSETPEGKHGSLFCRFVVTIDGEPITHNLGSGEVRVDKPLPPKAEAVAAAPKPKAEAKPAEKPLSPLERLRQEAAERARTEAGGGGE